MSDPICDRLNAFRRTGYACFPASDVARAWAAAARACLPSLQATPEAFGGLRHGGTWLPGLGAVPNAADGSLPGAQFGTPALALVEALGLWPAQWHRAQLSVALPRYPGVDPDERAGAARFRRTRDAAHLDGLVPVGSARRRHLREPHAFILGIAVTEASAAASPLVVWPESHRTLREALAETLCTIPEEHWPDVDLTDAYVAARRMVFDQHIRTEVPLSPGEAVLLHRHMLHGIAPWAEDAWAAPEGRAIAYFRPELASLGAWLRLGI